MMQGSTLNKNKRRGDILEYECRDAFLSHGFEAERARGSDGRSLGLDKEVDVVVGKRGEDGMWDYKLAIQCKRRKNLADYLESEEADIVCVRRDGRGAKRLYVIPEDILFELLEANR